MTLPELYLAYIADTGEELRDALLRVAGEPRSNPNRRNVHELLAEHLGDVAAVNSYNVIGDKAVAKDRAALSRLAWGVCHQF